MVRVEGCGGTCEDGEWYMGGVRVVSGMWQG